MKRLTAFLLVIFCAFPAQAVMKKDAAVISERYFKPSTCPTCATTTMTGDWGGTRTDLEAKGVTFASTYVADILGNPTGGQKKAAAFNSCMSWDVNFDLEKFASMKGTQFHISGLWRAGKNLSATIHNAFVVSSIYGAQQFRLYGLYIEKLFLDKKLNFRIGRIATGDDFASSPIYWYFVQNSIDGNPISIPINLFFPTYPTAVWGARAKYNFTPTIYSTTGIYNGDPRVGRNEAYGLDFSLRLKRGVMLAQELAWAPNTTKDCVGLPGHYKAGFYYHSGIFNSYYSDINGLPLATTGQAAQKKHGNYGVYFHADQMLYRVKGTDCDEGLTPFVVFTLAPADMNKFPFFIDGGLVYKGLIPTRHHDVSMVGFAYGQFSRELAHSERDAIDLYGPSQQPIQSYEFVVEFSHKIEITPWMFVQPDLQYIVNPSGEHDIDNAFVVGSRVGLTF